LRDLQRKERKEIPGKIVRSRIGTSFGDSPEKPGRSRSVFLTAGGDDPLVLGGNLHGVRLQPAPAFGMAVGEAQSATLL